MDPGILYMIGVVGVILVLFVVAYVVQAPAARRRAVKMTAELEQAAEVENEKVQTVREQGEWKLDGTAYARLADPILDAATFEAVRTAGEFNPIELLPQLGIASPHPPLTLNSPLLALARGPLSWQEVYRSKSMIQFHLVPEQSGTQNAFGLVEKHQIGSESKDVLMIGVIGRAFFLFWQPSDKARGAARQATFYRLDYEAPFATLHTSATDIADSWVTSLEQIRLYDGRKIMVRQDSNLRYEGTDIIETSYAEDANVFRVGRQITLLENAPEDLLAAALFAMTLYDSPDVLPEYGALEPAKPL